jgi:hypothetical protein
VGITIVKKPGLWGIGRKTSALTLIMLYSIPDQ